MMHGSGRTLWNRLGRFAGSLTALSAPLRLLAALIALAPAGIASAAEITYLSVTGSWINPTTNTPGINEPGDPVITNGDPTSIVRWGTTSGTPASATS